MKEKAYINTIKSAEKLFNRFGFAKTAVSDIARAAEVSRAAIFNSFGNKEGLLKAVLENKKREFGEDLSRSLRRSMSVTGRLKIILIGRVKLLAGMKFISEEAIAVDNRTVDGFFDELNVFFRKKTSSILQGIGKGAEEINGIVNTLMLMMKGLEQSVFDQIDTFSINQAENDIDFFLKLVIPEENTGRAL